MRITVENCGGNFWFCLPFGTAQPKIWLLEAILPSALDFHRGETKNRALEIENY